MGSAFSLRVVRCPACHARLPVHGGEAIVACEYCDARVQIEQRGPSRSVPPPPSAGRPPVMYTATPHYSGLAWLAFLVPVLAIGGVAVSMFVGASQTAPWASGDVPPSPAGDLSAQESEGGMPDERPSPSSQDDPAPAETASEEPGSVGRFFQDLEARRNADQGGNEAPSRRRSNPTPKQPDGPVLSVAEAKKKLEPAVLECMRSAGVHHVRLRMGNKTVGGVSILTSRAYGKPRVDGALVNLPKSKLGRCINAAGGAVRTRAFKGNYIIIDVRNPDVPDPLGHLPKKADREALTSAVAPFDDEVKACARKHGEEGRGRHNLSVRYDGPLGKLISVQSNYTSKAFNRCVKQLYRGISYPKVQEHTVEYTHVLEL